MTPSAGRYRRTRLPDCDGRLLDPLRERQVAYRQWIQNSFELSASGGAESISVDDSGSAGNQCRNSLTQPLRPTSEGIELLLLAERGNVLGPINQTEDYALSPLYSSQALTGVI